MAKNYTMREVAVAIATKDVAAMDDICKRFPRLALKMTVLMTKAGDEVIDLFSFMPDYLTANKVNKAIKSDEAEDADTSDEAEADADDEEVKEVKKQPKPAKKADDDEAESGYDSWGTNKLYTKLGELGERKACKVEFGDFKKASMVAYMEKHHPLGGVEDAEADEESEEEEVVDYKKMKAPELYALCKKRGIKAETKKPAKYYIELLEAADEPEEEDEEWGDEADTAEESADDDGWKDVEEKPKKKAGRPAKKAAEEPKKAAKPKATAKKAETEEDDDDWDI